MSTPHMARSRSRARRTWFALVAIGTLSLPTISNGQVRRGPAFVDCDYQSLVLFPAPDSLPERWRRLYPSTRSSELIAPMAAERWQDLFDGVRTSFAVEASRLANATRPEDVRMMRMARQLDSLRARMTRLDDVSSMQALKVASEDLRRVGPSLTKPVMRGDTAFLFRGSADEISLSDNDSTELRRLICYHGALASFIADRYTADARRYAATVLMKKEEHWNSYFERGYSQLPWELYLNSRAARSAGVLDPPTRQIILMHPAVSIQVAGANWRRLESQEALAVEPLGYIWYRDEYRSYFGISSVVVFANTTGTSVGPFLHFGRVAKVGYTFPLRQKGETRESRSGGALFSVDLYKYLSDRSTQVKKVMDGLKKQAN